MNRPLEMGCILLAVASFGCASRAHITETQGRSYSAAFAQQGPVRAKVAGPVTGLDSQEAAIVSDTYRRGLAPKNVQAKEQPILLVQPPQQGGGYGMTLAPSVPKEK